jgi:hypothetical protein
MISNASQLYQLVNEQLVVALALVKPDNSPHGTPVWIATDGLYLFFYTESNRKKVAFLKVNPRCTVVFNYGSVDGITTLISKSDSRFSHFFKIYDPRYEHESGYSGFKAKWDVLVLIKPTKIRIYA